MVGQDNPIADLIGFTIIKKIAHKIPNFSFHVIELFLTLCVLTGGFPRFGHPDMRASYSERLSSRQRGAYPTSREVYKSNSSLDLDHEAEILQESSVVGGNGGARREYGSHGSLDVMGRGREEQAGLGLFPTSEGPAAVSTLTRYYH